PPGSRAFTTPGHKDNQGGAYGLMELGVSVPLSANLGFYTATVQAQDAVTNAVTTTVVPIQVRACTPTTTCNGRFDGLCGPIPNGGGAPDFVEVGEAGIAVDHAMRR